MCFIETFFLFFIFSVLCVSVCVFLMFFKKKKKETKHVFPYFHCYLYHKIVFKYRNQTCLYFMFSKTRIIRKIVKTHLIHMFSCSENTQRT